MITMGYIIMAVGLVADYVTTQLAMARGAVETNVILGRHPEPIAMIALLAAHGVIFGVVAHFVPDYVGFTLLAVGGGLHIYGAANNVVVARRLR